MKTNSTNTTSLPIDLAIMCLFIFICGCNNNSESEPTNSQTHETTVKTSSISTKPSPPNIDIHAAVISNNTEALKQHILAGTDIDEKDPFGGSSPLISAALFNQQDMVKTLLDAGADLNFQNNDGSTALHTAAFFCRIEIVQILLDKGADKTIQNTSGSTAYNIVSGSFEEVKPIYDMLGQTLAPFGLVLDYEQLKTTRPKVAALLQ